MRRGSNGPPPYPRRRGARWGTRLSRGPGSCCRFIRSLALATALEQNARDQLRRTWWTCGSPNEITAACGGCSPRAGDAPTARPC
jgi:hypothetical protein